MGVWDLVYRLKYWLVLVLLIFTCGAVSARNAEFRVAIKTDGFTELDHDQAVVSSDGGPIILIGFEHNFVSSGPVTIVPTAEGILVADDHEQLLMGSPVWVYPEHNCRLTLESIKRGDAWGFSPSYRGFLEITLTESHKLQIINTVTVEDYLYGVVPSEMPVSSPLEALKAQAVASRTYVVRAIIEARSAGRSYHVDDSVFAQVYNNRQEDSRAKEAVDQTSGIVMLDSSGLLVRSYFHSTSSGFTAAAHEVWGGSTRSSFPGTPISYLLSRSVLTSDLVVDWSDEEQAFAFLRDKTIDSYEKQSPWFRWQVKFTRKQLEQIINANLADRYRAQPEFVLTQNSSGEFVSAPIPEDGIGELLDIKVSARGSGGNALSVDIVSTNGTFRVSKELNIRSLLCPTNRYTGSEDIVIHRMHDQILNYSLLPSANIAFEINRNNNEIAEVIVYGGGIGHGVGMSQWGARGMAEAGYSYEDILQAFYQDITLIDIYTVSDWHSLVFEVENR